MGRIAISILRGGQGLDSAMDDRFESAEAFLVAERRTFEAIDTIDNESANASPEAVTAAADALKSAGVDAVISGRFEPKAFDVLRARGIEAWIAPPGITAAEAVSMFRGGGLERMQSEVDRPPIRPAAESPVVG